MKFAFLSYLSRRYPLEWSFKMAAEYGYDGVEIWAARPHAYAFDMDKDAIAAINRWKKEYGVEISMLTPELLAYPYSLTTADEPARVETLAYLERNLQNAAAMGAPRMQITASHPGYGPQADGAWARTAENLARLCKTAEREGVDIVIESLTPSEGNTITSAADVGRMIAQVDSPALKGMLDLAVPVVQQEPFAEYFERLGEDMDYVHLCNSDGATEYHMQLGDSAGLIPVEAMFRVLRRCGWDGWCSLEILAPYFKDPELYLAECMGTIHDVCESLGIPRG